MPDESNQEDNQEQDDSSFEIHCCVLCGYPVIKEQSINTFDDKGNSFYVHWECIMALHALRGAPEGNRIIVPSDDLHGG